MKLEDVGNIAVLGAGIMGHGIAQTFLLAGYPVTLYDVKMELLDQAQKQIHKNCELFLQIGLIGQGEMDNLSGLMPTNNLKEAVEAADFILEAAPEDLPLKQRLFRQVEDICSQTSIIASNTSSLMLKDIGALVTNKGRLVITHWFNPPHIVPTVEVVKGEETSPETMDIAYRLLEKVGKMPIKIHKEMPGFVVNRIQIAMVREVIDLYETGIASAEDLDKAVKGSIGFRLASIGPLLTIDLAGVKLWLKVFENLVPHIRSSTEPPQVFYDLSAVGHDGIKSGKGFYDYSEEGSLGSVDETIKKRDREFLNRLKNLYWQKKTDG
jgi:3-hydroxybutyryl-CoA dehydrogenase